MEAEKKYSAIFIDDDKILLKVMGAYAPHTKYVDLIGSYLDPIEGIKATDELKPDILFLDVQLKEIDAYAVIEALEHDPIVIIVSSHWESESELIEAGASCFLSKPLKGPDQIDKAVEKALAYHATPKNVVKKATVKLDSNQEVLPDLFRSGLSEDLLDHGESWASFIDKFESKHPGFFEQLNKDFKSLTPTQLRICAYAKVGISLKNISSSIDMALESVESNISDIKEKLSVEQEDNLQEFLSIYN